MNSSSLTLLPKAITVIRNKHLNSKDLERLQNKKLQAIIKYSYENVSFYHDLFESEKIDPYSIRTAEDLDKLPILTKRTLRSVPLDQFTPRGLDTSKCVLMRTSGSSGIPLRTYCNFEALLNMNLRVCHYQRTLGVSIWGRQADALAGWAPRWGRLETLGAFRTIRFPSFTDITEMTKKITDFQTETLNTLPSFANALCKEVKTNGKNGLNLRTVITAGEILDRYTRKTCEDVLGAKVFDGYGTNELGFIAAECKHQSGLHVESDACIVEITRDGQRVGSGEEGEITVTNLVNTAFPLIRYNIEDVGKLEPDKCPCGSSFPLMRITQGRKSDTFLRSDGAVVPAVIIKNCLETIDSVMQTQVIQEKVNKFVVNVEKDPTYSKDPAVEIKSKLTEVVGPAEIEVIFQSEIPREHGRKLRYFVSKLT